MLENLFSQKSLANFFYGLAVAFILADAWFSHLFFYNWMAALTWNLPLFVFGWSIPIGASTIIGLGLAIISTALGFVLGDPTRLAKVIQRGRSSDNKYANLFAHTISLVVLLLFVGIIYAIDVSSTEKAVAAWGGDASIPKLSWISWRQAWTFLTVFGSDACVYFALSLSGGSMAASGGGSKTSYSQTSGGASSSVKGSPGAGVKKKVSP